MSCIVPARRRLSQACSQHLACRTQPRIVWSIRPPGGSSFYSTASALQHPRRTRWRWTALAALSLLSATALLSEPLRADDGKKRESLRWPLSRDDIGIICIIGGPGSGKSTQVDNVAKRFNLAKLDASHDLRSQIEAQVSKCGTDSDKPRVVLEGFPPTKEASDKFENDVCPILLIISIDMNGHVQQAIERLKGDASEHEKGWKRFEEDSPALIKRFRLEGNILEITGEWPADEVWEQVAAKLESALELDERHELY